MRDNMYENKWSPFDPRWYSAAFDQFISTADELFNKDLIIKQGFNLPDSDGSRSSAFRNEAILNNSFNEQALRETLKDIYLNSSHKLVASNHDNVHFYQWHGHMSDLELSSNTNICQFTIPTESFINAKERDKYKLSQFYRKWIKPEDILNNWEVFKWCCLLFINQRIYSDYELRIDDKETIIKFKYYDHWTRDNYPVYIYKLDTNASCRIKISKELCMNQWDWKIPVSYISDQRVISSTNLMVAFNKISDQSIRTDGLTNIDVLGDNLEFLKIENGYIDLSNISKFNNITIQSESTEWLWMSIIVPKFLHEYPILLPTDVIYRPYVADFRPVVVSDNLGIRNTKIDDGNHKQVYIDMNGKLAEDHDGWKQMIRPVVLSDAFDNPFNEPYKQFIDELSSLRDLTVIGADTIEDFRLFMLDNPTETKFLEFINKLTIDIDNIHSAYNAFLNKRSINTNKEYEFQYKKFHDTINELRKDGLYSNWFNGSRADDGNERDFWTFISPQIYIPREMYDKYSVIYTIDYINSKGLLWEDADKYNDQIRFRRPIDELDFWTFEYDINDQVWRPYHLDINRKFPDVYLPSDPNQETPELNRIFKAFFFYSDTINVRSQSGDIINATANWDTDMQEYEYDRGAIYRDIFMEKFYWMGVRSIYKGLLVTKSRWEAIEHVIDNESYERFNQLFLQTMDPYFKMGLATYLKSSNYEFPFDDAISKLTESINQNWLGYKRITNFELYLNKTWIPSYFDYVIKIMDDWNPSDRLIRRPRSSFDILRLFPFLISLEDNINTAVNTVAKTLDWIISKLEDERYNLNINNIFDIKSKAKDMLQNMIDVYTFTTELDLDLYGIEDLNHISDQLHYHMKLIDELHQLLNNTHDDIIENNVYQYKRDILNDIMNTCIDILYGYILEMSAMMQTFDMETFMRSSNDLYTYFDHNKDNPADNSLLGYINKFNDPWSVNVKTLRNKLFQSTSDLYGSFDPDKAYTTEEINEFIGNVDIVKSDLQNLSNTIEEFWTTMGYGKDQTVIDKFENVTDILSKLSYNLDEYMKIRALLITSISIIKSYLDKMDQYNISNTEDDYRNGMIGCLDNIIIALSYIAGVNKKDDALVNFNDFKDYMLQWINFIAVEEEVFTKLIAFTESPIAFIERLNSDKEMLNAIIEYINSVNLPFIPDSSWPTYTSIFSVDKIELVNGGFNHSVGEIVVIPNLGSYKIVEVEGKIARATIFEDSGYRNTTFRDPMIQSNIYDGVTNGSGMGIMVKPIHSNEIHIINDEIINMIIRRIQNSTYLVSENINTPNPYNNDFYNKTLDGIKEIHSDWNKIVDVYKNNLSTESFEYTNELVSIIESIIAPSEKFISTRSNIDLGGLITLIEKLISDSYLYASLNNQLTENYYYYEEELKIILSNLEDFYASGSRWDDSSQLKSLLDNSKYPIRLFRVRVIDEFPNGETKTSLIELSNSILTNITTIENTLSELPNVKLDITPIINKIETMIEEKDIVIHKDKWYRIRNIGVALEGEGYKIGDVVSLIPELPTDIEGNQITDMEDIIMSDTILVKIKEVIDGTVTMVEPIMDYAIPYIIKGIRETRTIIGNGKGLSVDIYPEEIETTDSIIFEDEESYIPILPQYNENDLFVFKFENIHDLNIQYEVFYGGKQITNFFQRHISSVDKLHPNSIDALYLNANEVNELKNSSIYIPAENYFVYKIDKIEIKDPGAGYAVGQEVFVDMDIVALRLKIAALTLDPFKGIADVEMPDIRIKEKFTDPGCINAEVSTDSLNNIDDEFNDGYYDQLTNEGIVKSSINSDDPTEYPFISRRFDTLENGVRNKNFMYPDVDMPLVEDAAQEGDPDNHWYLGSRIDNSQHPMSDNHKWNGIMNTISPTDPFIPDDRRVPNGKAIKGEYQLIAKQRIHNSVGETNANVTSKFKSSINNAAMVEGDYIVQKFSQLPKHINDWPTAKIGKCVIVENDETNNGHRMMYRLRTFVAAGFFVYDIPEIADYKWNCFNIDWMNCDFYPDHPSDKAKYPDAPWGTAKKFSYIQHQITDGKCEDKFPIDKYSNSTYIHNLTVDDISVWNCNTHEWEDLHDESKWKLDVIDDPDNNNYGFTLTYLEDGIYSYDMQLYLNKIPDTQIRNASLKRNSIMDIRTSIAVEVDKAAMNISVNTGRHLRIRKLFPYEQKETFTIGRNPDGSYIGYEMNFKVSPYIHFRNELHLEDVKIYNRTAGRFENILDPKMFEVRFKDNKAIANGYETQTNIIQSIISYAGEGFVDGEVWAYNEEFGTSVFGTITSDYKGAGNILTFTPIHTVNAPVDDITLEFKVFQRDNQTSRQMARVIIEFHTEKVQVRGDGYIHNVNNRYAPLPKEFKVICQYNLDELAEYDIIISKSPRQWKFIESKWMITPTFHLPDYNIQQDRVYIITNKGRFPLFNPSTGRPSINVVQTDDGTDVTFLNLYRRYEHLEVRTTPYPMRSVYVQRHIPSSGFIDLAGKINKPLNKKYFEFWVNGKLLFDEVTIITPTKIFLHGLKSLKNLEIIEVNRDPNEYFSDIFLEVESGTDRPYYHWNYETYLDAALEGNLEDDNYTLEEQEYLLSPVWKQVVKEHPEFKNFPPNVDMEDDILIRVSSGDYPLKNIEEPLYQFMVINVPTLEGKPIAERSLTFEHFGFIPMTNAMIIDILNEEWKEEIESDDYFHEHSVMTDDEWYGTTARLYDEYGIRVHTLDESAYRVADMNLLRINADNKISRIVKNKVSYDLD